MRLAVASVASLVAVDAHLAPRGDGYAVCHCWELEEIRKDRVEPYIHIMSGEEGSAGVFAELERLCEPVEEKPHGATDVVVYQALSAWLKNHRTSTPYNPFTANYFASQADAVEAHLAAKSATVLDYGCGGGEMLSELRKRGYGTSQLHCIEVADYIKSHYDMEVHILKDPLADLEALANGKLHGFFDVAGSFSVFHHIPSAPVYRGVFSSIAAMLKPSGIFLLNDWDSRGLDDLAMWYDVGHFLLWIFMGTTAPSTEAALQLGTRYDGVAGWSALGTEAGLRVGNVSTSTGDAVDPIGSFTILFDAPKEGSTPRSFGSVGDHADMTRGGTLRGSSAALRNISRHHVARPMPEPHVGFRHRDPFILANTAFLAAS